LVVHLRTGLDRNPVSRKTGLGAVALVLVAVSLLFVLVGGCSGEPAEDPRLLESERQLEGMYEACRTIKIVDGPEEHPPIEVDELPSLGPVEVSTTLKRSNGMEMPGTWTGPPLSAVLQKHGVQAPYGELKIEAWDGYVGRVPYELAARPDTILAYLENGEQVPEVDGPVRLVVGSMDGYYWVRMITAIEVLR
jgi:hypothetical protein